MTGADEGEVTPIACTPDTDHERLRLELMTAGRGLLAAAEADGGAVADLTSARDDLARFCTTVLLPQLGRDELCLQQAERLPETRLLAEAMRAQIRAITAVAHELGTPSPPWAAVAATRALHTMLAVYTHHHALLSSALDHPVDRAPG